MTTTLSFQISELVPYINWTYFYHTWGIKEELAGELTSEAHAILERWTREGRQTYFRVGLFSAHSRDEDIVLYHTPSHNKSTVLPLLRQQHPPFLCLADFVPPTDMTAEKIGVFASTVPFNVDGLAEQTLADRLAEATAERGHEIVRRRIWGYAPHESLCPKELFAERYTGKRPAVGYPSLPDQSLNFLIAHLLDFLSLGITLTENGAMSPHASTSGLMFAHPSCKHFSVGAIGEDQLQDYASRRGLPTDFLRRFIEVIS
ncbi:MAG: 5-methyltetrahydrofolate--homocysteine methyltransferase [Bacteroidaceae bacterium]|nr:5-methyltetrahydrofolate--homocysteine methyltransferase [Bacteroidaceae bacterium]